MRILNLYAGVGGNRALWPDDAEVVAVELDPEIAQVYATLWPEDRVVAADAHDYLIRHLQDGWDFIWSSPPCQTHSKLNAFEWGKGRYRYPQLDQLYGEIIMLKSCAPKGTKWIVENVNPYYQPLIPPTAHLERHIAWANFYLPHIPPNPQPLRISAERKTSGKGASRLTVAETADFERAYGITLPASAAGWGRIKRRQVMRNCVPPLIGKAVLDAASEQTYHELQPLWTTG